MQLCVPFVFLHNKRFLKTIVYMKNICNTKLLYNFYGIFMYVNMPDNDWEQNLDFLDMHAAPFY